MSKPARLYPKPEPMNVNSKFLYFGCILTAIIFFIIGWIFQSGGMLP